MRYHIPEPRGYYDDDIDRIVRVLARADIEVDRATAHKMWEAYSETSAAGWLLIHSDSEIVDAARVYLVPESDGRGVVEGET